MKQPMVVGNKGEIGRFILDGLLRIMPKAMDVWCVDINENEKEVLDRIKVADVIFVCVPMQDTLKWLLKYKIALKGKIILEQCSLKSWLFKNEKLDDLDIRSMHILFRPSQTPNLDDRNVALFKNQFNDIPAIIMPIDIIKITQGKIVWYENVKEHDKDMAIQQALLHRTILVLDKILKTCNGSTFISKRLNELADRIKKGNADLYSMIQDNEQLPKKIEWIKKELDSFDIKKFMLV